MKTLLAKIFDKEYEKLPHLKKRHGVLEEIDHPGRDSECCHVGGPPGTDQPDHRERPWVGQT